MMKSSHKMLLMARKKKKKRGPTRMGMVQSRIKITFNERGQPVAENSSKLSSYLGVIAREHIPIVIDDWRKVDEEIKQQLWELVQVSYVNLFEVNFVLLNFFTINC